MLSLRQFVEATTLASDSASLRSASPPFWYGQPKSLRESIRELDAATVVAWVEVRDSRSLAHCRTLNELVAAFPNATSSKEALKEVAQVFEGVGAAIKSVGPGYKRVGVVGPVSALLQVRVMRLDEAAVRAINGAQGGGVRPQDLTGDQLSGLGNVGQGIAIVGAGVMATGVGVPVGAFMVGLGGGMALAVGFVQFTGIGVRPPTQSATPGVVTYGQSSSDSPPGVIKALPDIIVDNLPANPVDYDPPPGTPRLGPDDEDGGIPIVAPGGIW